MLSRTRDILWVILLVIALASKYTLAHTCGYSWSNEPCDDGRVCCNHNCVYGSDCQGQSCYSSSDCGTYSSMSCCDGYCQYDCNIMDVGALVGGLLGAGVGIVILSALIYFCCCRRPVQPTGRVVAGERQIITTTSTTNYAHPPQPAPYQVPPAPYQQQQPPAPNYAQPPPVQYGGYGAMNQRPGGYEPPPQYQPQGAQASFAPPPYREIEQPVKNNATKGLQPSAPPL